MSDRVILVEIEVTSPAGETSTLRFSDRAIRPWPPSDPHRANKVWDDRIVEVPSMRRMLVDDLASLAPGWGVGTVWLANGDGALSAYEAYTFGAMSVRLADPGAAFADSAVLWSGVCDLPAFGATTGRPDRVSVPFFDRRADLDLPLQTTLYTGGNGVGGVLYEGLIDGLKGRAKPLAYGRLLDAHVPAPNVNGGVMAYQLHDGAIQGSEQVFDRGAPAGMADGGNYSGAAFDAANPAPATYVTDIGRGLLKFNSTPSGAVTFGLKGDAAGGYVETAGPIARRLLLRAGVPADRVGATIAAMASAAPIGVWSDDARNVRDTLAAVARSGQAAILPDRLGVWQAYPIAPPAAEADIALSEQDVLSIEADGNAPAPVGEVRVGWGRIYATTGRSDAAPSLSEDVVSRLSQEYRWATAEDATVKARMPSAWRKIEIETALRLEADALALAAALKALFGLRPDGRPRRQWKVRVPMTDALLAIELGSTIGLTYPRRSIAGNYLLIGHEPLRPSRETMIWTVWG